MRILLVNDYSQALGGKEKYLAALCAALREAGHFVGMMHTQPLGSPPSLEDDRIRFWVPGLKTYRGTWRTIARLRECLDLFQPDVVHVHNNPVNSIAVAWLMKRWPMVRSVHDVEFLCPIRYYMRRRDNQPCSIAFGMGCFRAGCLSLWDRSSWFRLLKSKVALRVYLKRTRMSAYSRFIQDGLTRLGFEPRNMTILPFFIELPKEIGAPAPGLRFLYVGRLNRMKGPQVVIEAMQRVAKPAVLDIVGAGELRNELERQVEMLGLSSRIRFLGYLEGGELEKCYRDALAIVVPTLMPEGYSLVIHEAFSFGKPVIATALGGNKEVVKDGISGFLVPHNDPAALADRMNKLIGDPGESQVLGSGGRQLLSSESYRRHFHIQSLIAQYQTTIEQFRKRGRYLPLCV